MNIQFRVAFHQESPALQNITPEALFGIPSFFESSQNVYPKVCWEFPTVISQWKTHQNLTCTKKMFFFFFITSAFKTISFNRLASKFLCPLLAPSNPSLVSLSLCFLLLYLSSVVSVFQVNVLLVVSCTALINDPVFRQEWPAHLPSFGNIFSRKCDKVYE